VKRKLALTIHKKLEILVSYKKVELERYNEWMYDRVIDHLW
jgi:hypothetical protein